MKKILCLILTLSFVLCSVGYTPLASDNSDELSDALTLFTAMGLIEADEDLEKPLTRADFAFRIAQFMNIDVYNNDGKSYFTDVPDTLWSKTAINALAERGFVVGNGGLYMPDRSISGMEAVKILLMLSGHSAEAEARGGWSGGYLLTATRLKLIKDISLGNTVSAGDFYLMLYRASQLSYMMPQSIEGDNVIYSADGTDTVLEFYHDIHLAEGRVTAVGASALSSGSGCQSDEIMLDGEIYKNPGESIDFYTYLAHEVEMYYHSVKDSDKTVVCIISGASRNEATTIYSENFGKVTDNGRYYTITYYDESGKDKEIRVDRGAVVLKNGVGVTEGVYDTLSLKHGYMTLLSYDGDSVCDVVRVSDGYDMVIGNINNENTDEVISMNSGGGYYYMRAEVGERVLIYDKYDSSLAVDISQADGRVIRLKNATDAQIDYDDLAVGDVVTIYKSDDNTHVEVVKGMGSVSGTLDSYSSSSKEATIGDVIYKLTDTCLKNHANEISVGVSAKYVLNSFGEIAYIEVTDDNAKLAYLIAMSYKSQGLSNSLQLKLFTVDGEMKIVDVAENIKVDADTVKGYDNIVTKISADGKTATRQMIRFGLNTDGKLNYLDLAGIANNESEDTLIETGSGSGVYYVGAKKLSSLTNCVFNTTKTKVFVIPSDKAFKEGTYDEDWFAVRSLSELDSGNSNHDIVTYRVGLHSDYEDAIVIRKDDEWGLAYSTAPLLIDKISRGVDENGDVVDVISAYTTGRTTQKYYSKDLSVLSGYNLQKGDLVWCMMDINGRIKYVQEVFYDAIDGKQFEGNIFSYSGVDQSALTTANTRKGSMIEYAYATEMSGDVLRYGYEQGAVDGACIVPETIYVIDTSNPNNPNIYVGVKAEIADYIRAGSACTKMLLRSSTYKVSQIYIYK